MRTAYPVGKATVWVIAAWLAMTAGSRTAAAGPPLPVVSRAPSLSESATARGESGGASFSRNGRFVLFSSTADNLVTNCHNGPVMDLFVRDLTEGTVTLISATPDQRNGGNSHTYQGAISGDGRFVVLESLAGNLVEGDGDDRLDYFLHDRVEGTTVRISPPTLPDLLPANDVPLLVSPALSADGSRAAFVRGGQLYVYERASGLTTLLTRTWNGPESPVPGEASGLEFSPDGSRLAFRSTAANLVRPPTGGPVRPLQLYVYQFYPAGLSPTNLTQLRLTNAQLPVVVGGYPVADHDFSDGGRYLAVALTPTSIASTPLLGIHRFDLETGQSEHLTPGLTLTPNTTLVLAAAARDPGLAFQIRQGSASPLYSGGFYLWTPAGGLELQSILVNGASRSLLATPVEFDDEGTRLLLGSSYSALDPNQPDNRWRYFLREMSSGQIVPATVDEEEAIEVTLSPDGDRVVFESGAATLAASDFNEAADLFLRPVAGGDPFLLTPRAPEVNSLTANGITAINGSVFSADGSRLVLSSVADDLVSGDTNGAGDVLVRERATGELRLVSVDREGLASGNGHSGGPMISADGRWVAFLSGATNLVEGDTNGRPDVFRRDLQTGKTVLVSSRPDGTSGIGPVVAFDMSADGTRFCFQARGTDLTGVIRSDERIYFRSLPDVAVQEISMVAPAVAPVISADGTVVGYVRSGVARLWVVASGVSKDLSRSPGAVATERILLNADGSRAILLNTVGAPQLFRRNADIEGTYSEEILPQEAPAKRRVKEATLSADGRWLTYAGLPAGGNPVLVGGNVGFNVYVRDLTTGVETQINQSPLGGRGNGDADQPSLSSDGRYVTFRSGASDLVPDDDNREADVFLHDRATGRTRLVTRHHPSAVPLSGRSYRGRFGVDTTEIWLNTGAGEAISGDRNGVADLIRIPLEPDLDADGLDDAWEQMNFGNLAEGGAGDFDQDSISNAGEMAAGTLPKDPASWLRATLQPFSEEALTLAWPAVPGKRYRVLMAPAFTLPDEVSWRAFGDVVTALGPTLAVQVRIDPGSPERFYTLAVAY